MTRSTHRIAAIIRLSAIIRISGIIRTSPARLVMALALTAGAIIVSFGVTLDAGGARGLSPVPPPVPYGALPSDRQIKWHELELYAFLHFTTNTFTDKEWGFGDEDPSIFNPSAFDADRIIQALKAGGMQAIILTAKHHDGFCLWPTKTTTHSVAKSAWRGGKGDVVKAFADASRRHGVKFGVYLSPWDRNHPQYGRPEYVQVYRDQLRELLTNYGPIFEVWHDGANGGDGYYGGAREKRTIDRRTYYDWPTTWELVRTLQPGAVIFSDVGPDVRWVGNEKGTAGETSWATYQPVGEDGGAPAPGFIKTEDAPIGHRHAKQWLPAECDVSIRPGWFWHEQETAKVKTPDELMDLYYRSVGRGCNLLLNVPPDRRGLIDPVDAKSLAAFGDRLRATFRTNLAATAKLTASNFRGDYDPGNLVDENRYSFWATDDKVKTPELVVDFGKDTTFSVVRLRENIRLGQRVEAFELDAWTEDAWKPIASATSIGPVRLVRLASPVTTTKVRLRITQSPVAVALSDLGIFAEPPPQ